MVLPVRSKLNGFASKNDKVFWSPGVLECWSVGVLKKARIGTST